MKVALIGCGNIGTRRALSVLQSSLDSLVHVVEVNRLRWPSLKDTFQVPVSDDAQTVITASNVEAVILSTPPPHLDLIEACLKHGKDVLCEKPLGETMEQVRHITALADQKKRVLKCGFNLRHDRGLERAKELVDQGFIGKPYFLKAHYVNGAVLSNTNGVGSLLDLGSHLFDLVNWFDGSPVQSQGFLQKTEFSRDDNGFVVFQTQKLIGQFHFSFLRWKNDFRFEISGNKGAVEVVSLPKWGTQHVHLYRRVFPSGAPEIITEEFTNDVSWKQEWDVFRNLVQKRDLSYNSHALTVMEQSEGLRLMEVTKK